MSFIRAQVAWPADTAMPADIVVNTWHFDSDTDITNTVDVLPITTALDGFYTAIQGILAGDGIDSPAAVKYYDLADAEPRVPFATHNLSIVPSTGNAMPTEVAACLSYKAATVSGQVAARRRGRVFLGPLTQASGSMDQGAFRITSAARTTIVNASQTWLAVDNIAAGIRWAVYSPTQHAATNIADAFNDVAEVWVDNAFDIQRRRGARASARTSLVLT